MKPMRVIALLVTALAVLVSPQKAGAHPAPVAAVGTLSVSPGLWEPGLGPSQVASYSMVSATTVGGPMSSAGSLTGHSSHWTGAGTLNAAAHSIPVVWVLVGASLTATGTAAGHTVHVDCSARAEATAGVGPGVLYATTTYSYSCFVWIT